MSAISSDFIVGLIILTFLIIARPLVPGFWSLAAGHCLLVIGYWLLITLDPRYWMLDTR